MRERECTSEKDRLQTSKERERERERREVGERTEKERKKG